MTRVLAADGAGVIRTRLLCNGMISSFRHVSGLAVADLLDGRLGQQPAQPGGYRAVGEFAEA